MLSLLIEAPFFLTLELEIGIWNWQNKSHWDCFLKELPDERLGQEEVTESLFVKEAGNDNPVFALDRLTDTMEKLQLFYNDNVLLKVEKICFQNLKLVASFGLQLFQQPYTQWLTILFTYINIHRIFVHFWVFSLLINWYLLADTHS